jgi:hypothetical protein
VIKVKAICAVVVSLLASVGVVAAETQSASFSMLQPEVFAAPGGLVNAWADVDNDGDADLAVGFHAEAGGGMRLYRNDGGRFSSVGGAAGMPEKGDEIRSLAWGDFDRDGDPDLYAATSGTNGGLSEADDPAARSLLFRNEGVQGFKEVGRDLGVAYPGTSSRQAAWIDYDNDGDLDLFVAQKYGRNRLYRNDGKRFEDVSRQLGLADPRRTVGVCWFDADRDGDLDVFLANQSGDQDALFRNDQEKFTDIAPLLGMRQTGRTVEEGGVACAAGDYDNDGDLDLFVATYGASLLYRNEGAGRFVEAAKSLGVMGHGIATGASWADYDNDGRPDLYVVGYATEGKRYRSRSQLFRNAGDRFIDVAAGGLLSRSDHGVQWADIDRDGDLDVSLTEGWPGQEDGHHYLLRNDLAPAQRKQSLQVAVLDRDGHRTRAGAEVRVFDAAGKLLGTRLVSTGDGYNAQSVTPAHFGIGPAIRVDIEVDFLTAAGRRTQRVTRVKPADWIGRAFEIRQARGTATE